MNIKSLSIPVSLWFVSFLCALYPVNSWQLFLFPVSLAALFAWSYTTLCAKMNEGWTLPRSPVLLFAGLFWLLVTASVFWSEVKPITLIAIATFSALPLTFFIATIGADEAFFKKTAYLLGALFGVLALWAVFQFFFLNAYFYNQARHPLADPASLGALFSLALFASLGRILSAPSSKDRPWVIALATALLCGIFATAARGPVIALLPGMALLCVFAWPQIKANRKALLIILAGSAVFYGTALTGVQHRLNVFSRIFDPNQNAAGKYDSYRSEVWGSAVEMIKDRPLLGTGFGTFFLYYPEYRKATEVDGVNLAHNDPLQFWVELGVLGPLLFYAFAGAGIFRTLGALKKLREEDNPKDRVLVASLFAGLTALVVGAHVGFSHYNLSILLLAGLILAYWFRLTMRVAEEPVFTSRVSQATPASLNKLLLALPFVMVGWMIVSLMAGEAFASRASRDLFAEKMFDFQSDINMSNSVSMGMNTRAYLLAVNVPLSILEVDKDRLDEAQKKKLYEQVVWYMEDVLAINPRAASAYYYLGKVQTMIPSSLLDPTTPTPEEYYKKALALDPMHLGSRLALLGIYQASGRSLVEQLAVMEPGALFRYNMPIASDYYAELAKLYLENKDYGKMNEALQLHRSFQKRSETSRLRQDTTLPQAIMGGDGIFLK